MSEETYSACDLGCICNEDVCKRRNIQPSVDWKLFKEICKELERKKGVTNE